MIVQIKINIFVSMNKQKDKLKLFFKFRNATCLKNFVPISLHNSFDKSQNP